MIVRKSEGSMTVVERPGGLGRESPSPLVASAGPAPARTLDEAHGLLDLMADLGCDFFAAAASEEGEPVS